MALNKGFKIIGVSVETSNENNQASTDLMLLWERFHKEGLLTNVPNQLNSDIYSIYTDYESDYRGKYTCLLGLCVSTLETIPEGLVGREFPAENFKAFIAEGELPYAVVDAWKGIWDADAELNRSYSYDFEVYSDRSRNGDQSEVDIYIATKN